MGFESNSLCALSLRVTLQQPLSYDELSREFSFLSGAVSFYQFIPFGLVKSTDLLFAALTHVIRRYSTNTMLTRHPGLELLVFLTQERQIKNALQVGGIQSRVPNFYLVLFDFDELNLSRAVDLIEKAVKVSNLELVSKSLEKSEESNLLLESVAKFSLTL